ncbi:hypothetical protein [Asticcacaulis excentricus]|uniref:Uncharacterized protein n=1 Tax=Asticcacaulis excentricus (strain ATCC 15261 / DSM 4724 / KCTC 12464 / NCIMB 9791 / VKM B-1370 / CB 48) TaxID=573065 RepID=E8RVU2_ASTEC|nr:hypothetical protein [Asticcacaulis excentricus]ADU15364.1 hypothetical protein Astex_3753 [Asticcacaulis excentricus CB 48]
MAFPLSVGMGEEDGPDTEGWAHILGAARAEDHFEEVSEDYRLELAEFYGIAEAQRRQGDE